MIRVMAHAETHRLETARDPQRRSNVAHFVLLTFAGSWLAWLAASAFAPESGQLVFLPGTVMPAVVALWLAGRESRQSLSHLLAGMVKWRVHRGYYLFAITPVGQGPHDTAA